MNIDFSTSIPIYLQIIAEFKRQIAVETLKPGEKIPSQRDLATTLKVNVNTVQRAYREMEALGLVETLRGQGTFVCRDEKIVEETRTEMLRNLVDDFVLAMRSLGLDQKDTLKEVEKGFKDMETKIEVTRE